MNHLDEALATETKESEEANDPKTAASSGVYTIEREPPYISDFRFSNKNKSFCALIGTGSPVSLIKKSVYNKYFSENKLLQVRGYSNFKGINNSKVTIHGRIQDQICLEKWNDQWWDIALLVVDDTIITFDMLLGREFFIGTKLKLIYQNDKFEFEHPSENKLWVDPIFCINTIEEKDRYIRVHLKDHTLFRYAPRRFSIMEKKELHEITDDLLKRKIIKPSISPYCSRVVLVDKRNGQKRICIDLRPLNQRVSPQKYPFPIIEDQLDQLYGKEIYTKLDLKDGFHQIDIHLEDTKYFAFAVPHGQYEYIKMPFGYSEASAEFQKRILYIFEPMVRSGKLLLYMDNILIVTTTVTENLNIIEKVLLVLKKYRLELNLVKCLFLKKEIEYLGYIISANGITLNKCHIQTILDYSYPKDAKQL